LQGNRHTPRSIFEMLPIDRSITIDQRGARDPTGRSEFLHAFKDDIIE
jgi:hypothetical protein